MTQKAVRVKTTDGWQDIGYQGPPGPPSGSMQLIQKIVLSASGTFDFQNIPQTFDHLKLIVRGRGMNNGINNIYGRINGNTGNNYDYAQMYLQGGQANAQGFSVLAQTQMKFGWFAGADSVAGYKGIIEVDIPDYKAADQKEVISKSFAWTPTAVVVSEMFTGQIGNIYRQPQAVTSLQVIGDANFAAGSTAWLYGIKAEPEGIRQNWSDIYCLGNGPTASCPNGVFTLVPFPVTPDISKADGINPDLSETPTDQLQL